MSILDYLVESLLNDAEELDDVDTAEPTPHNDETVEVEPSEEPSIKGDPKALIDAMLKYAPDKKKEITSMMKYAANSNEGYDIFDSALDYLESIEDEKEVSVDVAPKEDETIEKEVSTDNDDMSEFKL